MYNEVLKNVVEQVINMLTNNVIEEYGSEGFEAWCEEGEVFKDNNVSNLDKHIKVMERLAPLVDALSNEIDRIEDEENEQ